MRRFRFRLMPVLRLRAQSERQARRELAAAMVEVEAREQQLLVASRGVADCAEQAVRTDAVGRLSRALETGLRRHQWRVDQQRLQAQRQLDLARLGYAERARELRCLERLYDQQRSAFGAAVQRREQGELEEMAQLGRAGISRQEEGS